MRMPAVRPLVFPAALILMTVALTGSLPAQDDATLQGSDAPAGTLWLDSLHVENVEQDWGTPRAGRAVEDHALTIHGARFAHGVGTHAASEFHINLKGAAVRFVSLVGIDDETGGQGTGECEVWVDNRLLAASGPLKGGQAAKRLTADLGGAKQLLLRVKKGSGGLDFAHVDWAGGLLVLAADATAKPESVGTSESVEIWHSISPLPAINNPRITGATPGLPFLFLIPASGEKPLTFTAVGLPEGLTLDEHTGIISGSLSKAGTCEVELTAKNSRGLARAKLSIVGGVHKLALTPPMGWNSWNCWASAVSDAKVRAAADAMVASGLAAQGFQYVNIDDCWEAPRDAHGEIRANAKFPDMKGLADYVHSKGLKLGIYSSPGPQTCAGFPASWQHEEQDAKTYAKWGVDYLKYDWCSYGNIAPHPDREALIKPYRVMREALDHSGRDIVFSLCQYGMGDVWQWGQAVGGNCWRTTGDITDNWGSMSGIGFNQDGHERFAGPGHWNDPDMLVVGKVGWGPSLHRTNLRPAEQVTHITLWSLLSSPLLIGCDMSALDDFTLALLTNNEVLAVSQDPLGRPAWQFKRDGTQQVWARPLADGTWAAGLFNLGGAPATVKLQWHDLHLEGPQPARDLWQHKDLGELKDGFETQVPVHGAVLLKVGHPRAAGQEAAGR